MQFILLHVIICMLYVIRYLHIFYKMLPFLTGQNDIDVMGVVPVAHQKYAHRKMPTTICPRPFAHQIHKPTAKSPPKPKAHRQLPTDKCPRQKAHQWLWANIRGQIAVGK